MNRESMRMDQAFGLMHEAVRRIAGEVAGPHAADVDAKARFPSETVGALRDAGLLSAGVPRELGGAGCNLQEQAVLCSTLAQACGSSAMVLACITSSSHAWRAMRFTASSSAAGCETLSRANTFLRR
jgi:alkylation response protein AidB-like acyl-CoA dehydrogenase